MDSEAGHRFAILSISSVELRSAVRRRERTGYLGDVPPDILLARFDSHLNGGRFMRLPVDDALLSLAVALVDRYPLKASDAMQLAGCVALRAASVAAPVFAASDYQLLRAAEGEGLAVFDPAGR